MASHPAKSQRVLSCVHCQHRKIKCDKTSPCANCIKYQAKCVPATLAPRRRKRRFPEKALLERLSKYEELLRQNNIDFESVESESIKESERTNVGSDSDGEQNEADGRNVSTPSTTIKSERSSEAKYARWGGSTFDMLTLAGIYGML